MLFFIILSACFSEGLIVRKYQGDFCNGINCAANTPICGSPFSRSFVLSCQSKYEIASSPSVRFYFIRHHSARLTAPYQRTFIFDVKSMAWKQLHNFWKHSTSTSVYLTPNEKTNGRLFLIFSSAQTYVVSFSGVDKSSIIFETMAKSPSTSSRVTTKLLTTRFSISWSIGFTTARPTTIKSHTTSTHFSRATSGSTTYTPISRGTTTTWRPTKKPSMRPSTTHPIPAWAVVLISIVGTLVFLLTLSAILKKYRSCVYYRNVINDEISNNSENNSENNEMAREREENDNNSFETIELQDV